MAEPLDFGPDNSGHDIDCDCKACLIDTWHAEVTELRGRIDRLVETLTLIANHPYANGTGPSQKARLAFDEEQQPMTDQSEFTPKGRADLRAAWREAVRNGDDSLYPEFLEAEIMRLRAALDDAARLRAILREWLDADDAAEIDFNDQTEARLDAAIAAARKAAFDEGQA